MPSDPLSILDRLEKLASDSNDERLIGLDYLRVLSDSRRALPALVKALRKALDVSAYTAHQFEGVAPDEECKYVGKEFVCHCGLFDAEKDFDAALAELEGL